MLKVNQLNGFGVGGAGVTPVALSVTDTETQTPSATTYTFSSKSLGAASSDRIIAAVIFSDAIAGGISSSTINGVSGTTQVETTKGNEFTGIITAAVPTGTTGDVVVTFDDSGNSCALAVYSITGASSITAADTLIVNSDANPTGSLTVGNGGCIITAGYGEASNQTWVYTEPTTEGADLFWESVRNAGSGYDVYEVGGTKSIDVTTSVGSMLITFCAMSLDP